MSVSSKPKASALKESADKASTPKTNPSKARASKVKALKPSPSKASLPKTSTPKPNTSHGVRVILGIDPGLLHTGWGLVRLGAEGSLGYLRCGLITTHARDAVAIRLAQIHAGLAQELKTAKRDFARLEVAVEETFVNVNAKSSLVLGMARGVALLAVAQAGLTPFDYAPNAIKSAVTGNGHADKEQVAKMVRLLLPELQSELQSEPQGTENRQATETIAKKVSPLRPLRHDTLDALAVAICHAQTQNFAQALEPTVGATGA